MPVGKPIVSGLSNTLVYYVIPLYPTYKSGLSFFKTSLPDKLTLIKVSFNLGRVRKVIQPAKSDMMQETANVACSPATMTASTRLSTDIKLKRLLMYHNMKGKKKGMERDMILLFVCHVFLLFMYYYFCF